MMDSGSMESNAKHFVLEWLSYLQNVDGVEPRTNEALLEQLGCAYVRSISKENPRERSLIVPRCQAANLERTQKILPVLLKLVIQKHDLESVTLASLLHGVHVNAMLPIFLQDEDSTYDLTVAILLYTEFYEPSYPLDAHLKGLLCEVLNTWLQPETPWLELPRADVLAQYLFGDALCLFIDGTINHSQDEDDDIGSKLGDLVAKIRPPFLPGRCPAQDIVMAAVLPEMEGPL